MEWADWNWRTDGDLMANGAFFVPSGAGLSAQYARASSLEPESAGHIDQLTMNAGVFGGPRDDGERSSYGGGTGSDGTTNTGVEGSSRGDGDIFGMIFGSSAPPRPPPSAAAGSVFLSLSIILVLYTVTANHGALSSFKSL